MLIDTHCHINIMLRGYKTKPEYTPLTQQEKDQAARIIKHAHEHNVSTIFNVGTDIIESKTCIELAQHFNNNYAVVGIHPNDATQAWKEQLTELHTLVKNKNENKIIGIGECGIDKHYPGYNLERQIAVFKEQIELALSYNIPLIVHSRDADEETAKTLEYYKNETNFRGIIHCFSSDASYAQEYLAMHFVLGVGGTATYSKNDVLREAIATAGINNIVLETDAPFLSPQKKRGKQNTPGYVHYTAEYIADFFNTDYETIAQTTTQNVISMFTPGNEEIFAL